MACERCDRLRAHCRATAAARKREFRHQEYWGRPVPGFGDPDARLVIVGLAPAAHGANRTGRMFTGDSSGDWLFEALHRTGFASQPASTGRDDGLTLTDCYIAASARCAPPDNKPTTEELEACRPFLAAELELLTQKRIILVLGRIAWERYLKAAGWWSVLSPRERPPFSHGAESILPDGVTLISSFHPSRQNTNTGRLTREMWHGVFERARALVGRKGGRAEGRKGGRKHGQASESSRAKSRDLLRPARGSRRARTSEAPAVDPSTSLGMTPCALVAPMIRRKSNQTPVDPPM